MEAAQRRDSSDACRRAIPKRHALALLGKKAGQSLASMTSAQNRDRGPAFFW
jgi:hypothetical protein